MHFLVILGASIFVTFRAKASILYGNTKYFIGFPMTLKRLTLNVLENCHFSAKICFLRRFDWIRLHGFRTQLRESEKKIDLHCQRQKSK